MSRKGMPIKGDVAWLKTLKEGDLLYVAEYSSEKNEVTTVAYKYVGKPEKQIACDQDDVYGIVKVKEDNTNIKTTPTNLSYGFFQTPLLAFEAFKAQIEQISRAAEKAIEKENKRLEAIVTEMKKGE